MNRGKFLMIALVCLSMLSCTSRSPKQTLAKKMDYPVSMSLSIGKNGLRAEHKSTSLSASFPNERAIENLTVCVFTNNGDENIPASLEKIIPTEDLAMPSGEDPYSGAILFDMKMSGTFYLEVIANGYKDDTDKDRFLSRLQRGISYEQFKQIVMDRPLPQHGEKGFVMLSAEPVKVTTERHTTADAGTVKLRRLACRFDVFNKLVAELVLTKATLQNAVTKSFMTTSTAIPSEGSVEAKSYDANGDWFTSTVIGGGIYSYENPSPSARTTLLLEGTYKGKPWKKTIEFKQEDEFVSLLRNHIYRIYLTKGNGITPGGGDGGGKDPSNADKVHYLIQVMDWSDDQDIDYNDDDVMQAESVTNLMNPLRYVAEYNINKAGDGFVTDKYATNVSGYFQTVMAMRLFANTTIGGKPYHLPSREEWQSIFPSMKVVDKADPKDITQAPLLGISFKEPFSKTSSEEVEVAGERVVCHQEMKGLGDNKCYALRYKGTKYQSAWKYEFVKINNYQVLQITSRNVGKDVTLEAIAQDAYWQQNRGRDVVRIIPASGFYDACIAHYDWMRYVMNYPYQGIPDDYSDHYSDYPFHYHGHFIIDHSAYHVGAYSSCTFPNSSSSSDRDHLPYIAMFGERNTCTSIIPFSPFAKQSVRLFEGPGKPIPMEYYFYIDENVSNNWSHPNLGVRFRHTNSSGIGDQNQLHPLMVKIPLFAPVLYLRFPELKKGGVPYRVPLLNSSYTLVSSVHGDSKEVKIGNSRNNNNEDVDVLMINYLSHKVQAKNKAEDLQVVKMGDVCILRAVPKYESGLAIDAKLQVKGVNPLIMVRETNEEETIGGFSGYYPFQISEYNGKRYNRKAMRKSQWLSLIPSIKIDFKHPMNPSQELVDIVYVGRSGGVTVEDHMPNYGTGMECRQRFKGSGNGVVYGLRYIGTFCQSAWKYEWVSTGGRKGLQITSRNVDDGISLATIASAQFWQQNSDQDEKVFFPAMGYIPEGSGTQPQEVGRKVMMWATSDKRSDDYNTQTAYCVSATEEGISCCTEKVKVGVRMPIRSTEMYSSSNYKNKLKRHKFFYRVK
ncbi:hypothetical protein HMPREF1869_01366 [Bacteroidales bacterium KA00251]|nr:hypothetical protein HMPREF1869_01366 [Bacteroidales bacterium KA00251]